MARVGWNWEFPTFYAECKTQLELVISLPGVGQTLIIWALVKFFSLRAGLVEQLGSSGVFQDGSFSSFLVGSLRELLKFTVGIWLSA